MRPARPHGYKSPDINSKLPPTRVHVLPSLSTCIVSGHPTNIHLTDFSSRYNHLLHVLLKQHRTAPN